MMRDNAVHDSTIHGPPVTISQCTFQAHIARVSTVAEVRAISTAVSTTTEQAAALSEFVGPFAYRLRCVAEGARQSPRDIGDHNRVPEDDFNSQEGFCDNGDVGSGEKLLALLQKWDVRQRVLMVTRIDGGFMRAELLGVRRYKFVVDRAKKLLENTDLVSLRRAVDTDIHPPTISETITNLAVQKHPVQGPMEDGWDHFVVPSPTRKGISDHSPFGHLLDAPGGDPAAPPQKNDGEGRGRGGKVRSLNSKVGWYGTGSTRARRRTALSLAHLSISSKTVHFPRGHVPSVMGDKGYGKKRGRINHFAVRTPPPSPSGGDDDDKSFSSGGSKVSGVDAHNTPGAGPSSDDRGRLGTTSGWSLPRDLDPTSAVTSAGNKAREETANSNSYSIRTAASRVSTCDTINSPSRVAAIVLGVTGVHTALPPPFCDDAFDGESASSSEAFSRVDAAPSSDTDLGGSPHPASRPDISGTGDPGKFSANGGGTAWSGDAFPHGLMPAGGGGGGGGSTVEAGGGLSSSSGTDRHGKMKISPMDGCMLPPDGVSDGGVRDASKSGGGGGGCSSHSTASRTATGHSLPLLHRAAGSGVRDRPPPSLVVVAGGGCHVGAGPPAPLSNESMMTRWKSDDDGSSSISTSSGGGRDGAREGGGSGGHGYSPSTEEILQGPRGGSSAVFSPDELALCGTTLENSAGETWGESSSRPSGSPKEWGTPPATGESEDLVDLRGIVSGRSDPPPTRSKSALRGWSVGRSAPACSPLVTTKRTVPSKTGK